MIADLMEAFEPSYEEMDYYYRNNFSLGSLNTTLENKFGLISLICFLTQQARRKTPDATCYQVIMKITKNKLLDDYQMHFVKGLSVICEDFMRNTTNFLTFDLKSSKEIVAKILEILDTWLPF